MQNQNVPIRKGPDKWLLAESIFHDDEFPDDVVTVQFTVEHESKEYRLRVQVDSIAKARSEGNYLISGMGDVRSADREGKKVLEHVPVKLSYSVKTRTGTANVNF